MTYSFMSCSHSTFHLLEKLLLRANLRWCPKKSARMATRPQRSKPNSVFWKKSKLPLRSRKFMTHFTKTTYTRYKGYQSQESNTLYKSSNSQRKYLVCIFLFQHKEEDLSIFSFSKDLLRVQISRSLFFKGLLQHS